MGVEVVLSKSGMASFWKAMMAGDFVDGCGDGGGEKKSGDAMPSSGDNPDNGGDPSVPVTTDLETARRETPF